MSDNLVNFESLIKPKEEVSFESLIKKKEPTSSGFSVTPLPSQDKFQQGLAMAKSPIASAVKKDTQKNNNWFAGMYNNLVKPISSLAGGTAYLAEAVLGGRPETMVTRLASAREFQKSTESFFDKLRSEKSSKEYEQEQAKEFDVTPVQRENQMSREDALTLTMIDPEKLTPIQLKKYNEILVKNKGKEKPSSIFSGVDAKDVKSMAFQTPGQLLSFIMGAYTAGTTYIPQSISDASNEIYETDKGNKLNDGQKAAYIFTQAAAQYALEKVSLDLILKNTGLGKAAKQKIANEIVDKFVAKGVKATAEDVEKEAIRLASSMASKAKRIGIKAATGAAVEPGTEALQTGAAEGVKLLTNKISKTDVFNEEDIIANLGKNMINSAVMATGPGAIGGGFVGSFQNTKKAIREEIANEKDVNTIQSEINKQVEEGNITPEEAQAANITAKQYADIASKIPSTVTPQDKYKIIGGIEQREALNIKKQQAYEELTDLDPVFKKEKQDQIDLIQAKIDETNDYLEGIVSGKKVQYKEKKGMYFKVDSEGNETPINKETYDLAKSIREEDERKAKEAVDTAPAVIMPEENVAPEVVKPSKGAAVIMPEENIPAETTVVGPQQQGKAPSVIMPEAVVTEEVKTVKLDELPDRAFAVGMTVEKFEDLKSKIQKEGFTQPIIIDKESGNVLDGQSRLLVAQDLGIKDVPSIYMDNPTKADLNEKIKELEKQYIPSQEVKPTEVKPEVKSKLEAFKTKFAPQPKEVSISGVKAADKRVFRQQAAKIAPTNARGFALQWMNQSPDVIDWNSIKDLFGGRRARLNVKEVASEEISKRDYVAQKDVQGEGVKSLNDVVNDIWNNLPEGYEDKITTQDIKDEIEGLISEYPTRAEAARALVEMTQGEKGKTLEEQQLAFEEGRGIVEGEEIAPVDLEGMAFVPFEEGDEELPFAVEEPTTEEVAQMQDIVKDYIDDGTTSLSEIKKAIAKELGYNTKKLRQTIDDAYSEYTRTTEAALLEVKSGLLGRVGNAMKKMFPKDSQKPFIAKDGKALDAKAKNVAETGGRVSFQATLGNGETVTAKPVDASIVNGFYSPLELQINQMKQDKMPAKQWLDKLRGEEAKWTGLSDWLSQQEGSLTKENIKNWLQDNQIEINEIVKGDPDFNNKSLWEYSAIGDGKWTYKLKGRSVLFQIDASEGDNNARLYVVDSGGANEIGLINYSDRDQILDMALERNTFESYIDDYDLNTTKYSKYTLEGEKEDYKEILITYPTPPKDLTFEKWNTNRISWGEKEGTLEEYKKAGVLYRSNHFDERNILVHVRSDIRTDSKGNKIYFIEEVQSDWGQEGKKKGFYDLTDNELKRFNELKPVMPILSDAQQNAHQALFYAYKYDVSTSIEEFYKLPVQERKNKINETHNKYQERTNNYIASIQKGIDDRNKQISDNIDKGLLLEEEELKYDKALRNAKNNKVVVDGKEIDLNIKKEYDAYNNKLKQLDEEIKDLDKESVKLEEENGIYSKQIDNLNKDKEFDDSEYIFAIKNSELTFDKNEYDKITKEFAELENKIKIASINKAPFVTKTNDWAKLGLKVALKNAVESGASKIAWTNGEQQNERYDLSKQVNFIERIPENDINKEQNDFYLDINLPSGIIGLNVNKDSGVVTRSTGSLYRGDLIDKPLSDVIGKDMADKIMSGGAKKYEGDGLKIGGKGMKGFYGSPSDNSLGILGDLAKSLYKQTPEKLILNDSKERKIDELRNELDRWTTAKTNNVRLRDDALQEGDMDAADVYQKEIKKAAENENIIINKIKKTEADYQYSINITPELKAQVEVGLPLFMANPSGADILGFSFANRMYLNGEKLNPNTIIHEAGHIWTEWTKINDPKIYEKGMELVEGSPYLKKAKESKFYQQQAEKLATDAERLEYFKHEALAMAIGDKGAQFVVESKRESFKDWLKTLWTKIKSLTGFKDLTDQEFQDLTFEEFSKMAVKEILGVENDLDQFQAARSIKKKKEFVKGKVRGEANKRAIDDFEVDDMIKLIKADYDLQTLKNIKDAIQKRSAEEVLPSQPRKIGERRGERKRVEPRVEGDEAAGEGEATPTENIEKEWQGAITIAANEERRQMLGLPEYQREKQSFEEWTNKAIKMIKKGYNVEKLLDKMEKGNYSPTPEENQIRKIYVAKLKSDYDANPTPELEKKLIRYTQLNDIVNSQLGRQLRSLADVTEPRETLADFVISKMEANNVDELTEKQRKQVEKQYTEIKNKEEDVEAKLEINDELNTQLLAETVFKEEKAKRKPYQKTKDYKADRKSIIESIKQKWKDKDKPSDVLMALPFPVPTKKAQQLVAIAPDVNKLMASYIEEGVDDLKEIVSRIYVDLRNEIDGLSEKDIFDVIAGRYKKEKPLLNQLQLKKAELKKEAELIAKIEDIMVGNMPTNEKAKIEQNQKLTQLRNELRDLKKEVGFYDLPKINSLKEKNLEKIKEIDEKIQKGDFEKAIKAPSFLENPEFRKKYPKEYEAYIQSVKELSDKKHEFEVSLAKDEVSKMNIREKIMKKWWPEFKSTLSGILATLDNSFIFIQLGPAIWSNPLLLPKVLNEQRKVIFNEGRFKREIVQIFQNKELANLIEVSGLDILDPQTLKESLREEQLGGTDFLERSVEIKGKKYSLATIIKAPFERIAVAAGNYVRLRLFLESVSHLEAEGKTIETHEKEFKDAARVANEMTARGELSEEFKTGWLKTLSSLTWAPKMIGSTLNLLGIGDLYNWSLGRKGYYASLSPELKKAAIGKMATAITVPYLIMAAIALDDDFEVDYDPRSVTFGQLKQLSTGDSWNPYGRFTSVVRYIILMLMGVRYINDEQMRADFKKESYKFIRGKMAPAYGLGLDVAFREGFDGEPLSFNDIAKNSLTPLALRDLKTYLEDDGTWGLITKGLPAITGIKVGIEKQYNQAKQPLEDVIKKHARTDDTYYSFELKNPTTKEIATKEQFNKFVKERDRLIAEKLTNLYNGYVITDSPNPVPFVSLEAKEAGKEISAAKTEATKEAKEAVFGKKKKTAMERLIERKRRLLRR